MYELDDTPWTSIEAPAWVEAALGRPVVDMDLIKTLNMLSGRRVLITGAAGSIGQALAPLLRLYCDVWETDEWELDVTNSDSVFQTFQKVQPEVIFHLAGAKHAPLGEEDPWHALEVNAIGTDNVLRYRPAGSRVVLASTCKACNPETAYGASKLIAERLTLNEGQTVARFYNVAETQGNVFDIWSQIAPEDPIPWTDCRRYFMSASEAICLLLWSASLPPARYTFRPIIARQIWSVARAVYPSRELAEIPLRRGDRRVEPQMGDHETILPVEDHPALGRVVSPHD
jgi:FlaA1/EpsC-like NDP-sugar epimerase